MLLAQLRHRQAFTGNQTALRQRPDANGNHCVSPMCTPPMPRSSRASTRASSSSSHFRRTARLHPFALATRRRQRQAAYRCRPFATATPSLQPHRSMRRQHRHRKPAPLAAEENPAAPVPPRLPMETGERPSRTGRASAQIRLAGRSVAAPWSRRSCGNSCAAYGRLYPADSVHRRNRRSLGPRENKTRSLHAVVNNFKDDDASQTRLPSSFIRGPLTCPPPAVPA